MLSFARVLVAFHAAIYLALVGITPTPFSNLAAATPFPMPMRMANTTEHTRPFRGEAGPRKMKTGSNASSPRSAPAPRTLSPLFSRSVLDERQDLGVTSLVSIVNVAHGHASNLKKCSNACSSSPSDAQRPGLEYLSQYHDSLLLFQTTIQGKSDEGLAYYNKNDDLQKLIRQIIDLTKEVLNYVHDLIACLPLLGPLLGPLVYAIKCFLDWLLNFCEDATDATLNDLCPLIQELIGLCGNCSILGCLL